MEAVHLQGFAHREAPEPTIEGQPEPALPVIPGKEQVVPVLGPQIGDWKVESAHDLVVPFPVTAGPGEPEMVICRLPQFQVAAHGGGREEAVPAPVPPDVPSRFAADPELDGAPVRAQVAVGTQVDLGSRDVDLDPAAVSAGDRSIVVASGRPCPVALIVGLNAVRRVEAGQQRGVPVPLHGSAHPVGKIGRGWSRPAAGREGRG